MDFDNTLSEIYPWILQVARRYCRSIQDAEDLAGETIFKMLQNRDKFDNSKPIKPWCITIMQNTFITLYNRSVLVHFTSYDEVAECRSSSYSAYSLAIFHDTLSAIHRCASHSCCMECVIYYAKGYSYDEISELIGIPIGTVRSRISFGRKMMHKELNHLF